MQKARNSRRNKRRILIIGRRRRVLVEFPPSAPVNLMIQVHPSDFSFSWMHNYENVDGFRLYRKAFEGDPFLVVAELDGGDSVAYDAAIEPGIIYTYYLAAFNEAGESLPSNEVTGEIVPGGE